MTPSQKAHHTQQEAPGATIEQESTPRAKPDSQAIWRALMQRIEISGGYSIAALARMGFAGRGVRWALTCPERIEGKP